MWVHFTSWCDREALCPRLLPQRVWEVCGIEGLIPGCSPVHPRTQGPCVAKFRRVSRRIPSDLHSECVLACGGVRASLSPACAAAPSNPHPHQTRSQPSSAAADAPQRTPARPRPSPQVPAAVRPPVSTTRRRLAQRKGQPRQGRQPASRKGRAARRRPPFPVHVFTDVHNRTVALVLPTPLCRDLAPFPPPCHRGKAWRPLNALTGRGLCVFFFR